MILMILGTTHVAKPSIAAPVRLASWNIANLSAIPNQPLRPNSIPRSTKDLARLAYYGTKLNADIIALQEIGSPKAIWRVFDKNIYEVIFSSRYKGTEDGDIYTAIIYRKDKMVLKRAEYLTALAVTHHQDGRQTRQGVAGLFEINGTSLWVMSVHLKAGCIVPSSLEPAHTEACKTYAKQVPILEKWIDDKHLSGAPVFVVGDFNRKFDRYGVFDHMWEDIDDSIPNDLNLHRLPYFTASKCPTISKSLAQEPVDFFVFNDMAKNLILEGSFGELLFSDQDAKKYKKVLSDHCPIFIELEVDALQSGF